MSASNSWITSCPVPGGTSTWYEYAELSPALATALAPVLGYDKAAQIAKDALAKNKTIRDLVVEEGLLDAQQADELLDPAKQTGN